jgi:2-polyprenyl-3-methyl-5-hydroxy-6-metoxy-1,4-benzoquinol methylase
VDRKFFHALHQCLRCRILFRYPNESAAEMANFYQSNYAEPGLTTDLPNERELNHLLATNFAGSSKDFSYHIKILRSLGLKSGDRLLDFGANWGYATLQFRNAGFAVDGFELSRPRAEFGRKLGLEIATAPPEGQGIYDAVYSCHVLEHVPNPLETLKAQLRLVRPGGLVVAHTPNGSAACRAGRRKSFHSVWGRVHPVLLNEEFISRNFAEFPHYVSSDDQPEKVNQWDRCSSRIGPVDGGGFFFALANLPLKA